METVPLEAGPLKQVADGVAHDEQFWTESFDRLDAYLSELHKQEKEVVRKQAGN
jgi:phage-related minor tail protein